MTNTVAYSAGRVCYPTRNDARRSRAPGEYRGQLDAWWPGREVIIRNSHNRVVVEYLAPLFPLTQRDYMAVEGP